MIQKETTMRLDCITQQLNMGNCGEPAASPPNPEDASPPIAPCGGRSKQYQNEQC